VEKQERLDTLRNQLAVANALLEDVPIFVRAARMAGATWEEIGAALGVTKQRAHQLYAHKIGYDFPLDAD
jgi:hypothetical protein